MKGNLSKKKGFLGDITEGNLDYIAGKLNTEYGERLTDTEASVLNITQTIIPDLKNELTEYTDDMVDEAYKGIEVLETTVKGKEDVSNKIMVADDDGTYWSAAMTDMKTYQTIEKHIVQDLNKPREDRIPSAKAVSEAIKGIKPDIDLSDYVKNTDYATKEVAGVVKVNPSAGIRLTDNNQLTVSYATKNYIDAKASYVNPIVPAFLEYAVQSCTNQDIEAELSEEQLKLPPSTKYLKDSYYTKEEIINMDLASKIWVSDRINTQLDNYYNKMEINEMIGDVETSLENIIEKYGLGGDAT